MTMSGRTQPSSKRHETAHRSSDHAWSSGFADTSPYRANVNDDADEADYVESDLEYDYELDDPNRNLDLSRRTDLAEFTTTPFSIAAKHAESSKSRKQRLKTDGPFAPVQVHKTLEEKLADQEAADRRGGSPVIPAVEQKLPVHDDRKNGNNEWAWRNHGWVDVRGRPVAASRPAAKSNQPNILDALDKIDKSKGPAKAKGRKGKKRKAAEEDEPSLLPPSPPKPKSFLERLDDLKVDGSTVNFEGQKNAPPAKKLKTGPEKGRVVAAKAKGQKKKGEDKDDGITFGILRESKQYAWT